MISWLLSQLLPFTVLLALLLLMRPMVLRWLGARWQYSLWGAVPMLLLLSAVPLSGLFTGESEIYQLQVSASKISLELGKSLETANIWAIIWLIGVMVIAVLLLKQQQYLAQVLNLATPLHLDDVALKPKQSELSDHRDNRVNPFICKQSQQELGPFVTGFFRPTLLLPQDFQHRFSPLQQQLILKHELTHWQRGDLHWNYLALFLLTLFWFHPLSWLAYRAYRQDQELACDALVLKDANAEQKIAYSYALLSNAQHGAANWQLLTNHYGDKKMMKQRLIQIKQQHGFSKTAMAITLAMVLGTTLWLQQPVQAAGDVVAPTIRVEPKYPVQAARQKIEGYVVAEFDIQPDGRVENVKVIKAVPEQVFEKEAVRALQQWAYSPSAAGMKKASVRLDLMMDPVDQEIERIDVTPSK